VSYPIYCAFRPNPHRIDHVIILAHAEIIVRAPDRDFPFAIFKPRGRLGKPSAMAVKIDEDPIAAFAMDFAEGVFECFEMLHGLWSPFWISGVR